MPKVLGVPKVLVILGTLGILGTIFGSNGVTTSISVAEAIIVMAEAIIVMAETIIVTAEAIIVTAETIIVTAEAIIVMAESYFRRGSRPVGHIKFKNKLPYDDFFNRIDLLLHINRDFSGEFIKNGCTILKNFGG